MYSWIDTPHDNVPLLLPRNFFPIVFSIFERFAPNATDIFFNQSLNKKLGTYGLNVSGIAVEAAKRNMDVMDVMAMVE